MSARHMNHVGWLYSTALSAASKQATRQRTETVSHFRIPESSQGKGIPKPQTKQQ